MYEFLTGPMLWASFAFFFFGLAFRVVWYVRGLSWQLDRVAYGRHNGLAFKFALKSIGMWLLPFGSRSWRLHPVFTLLTFTFHVCLVATPLLLQAHVLLFRQGLGLSWPVLPAGVADAMTIACITAGVLLILRRIALAEVRILTTCRDYALLAVSLAPFVTGLIARFQPADAQFWLLAHIVAGEIMLIAIPLTKLSHMVLFFCSRAQLGVDYGTKRGGQRGRGLAW
jgi:nitrate reductase gamma subunit